MIFVTPLGPQSVWPTNSPRRSAGNSQNSNADATRLDDILQKRKKMPEVSNLVTSMVHSPTRVTEACRLRESKTVAPTRGSEWRGIGLGVRVMPPWLVFNKPCAKNRHQNRSGSECVVVVVADTPEFDLGEG